MVIAQGEVWWADLGDPAGSEPGFRRPVVVVQGDAFNASSLRTVVCVALTSNTRWADAPGNVLLTARATGLPKPSVANVSQLVTLDRTALTERAGPPVGVEPRARPRGHRRGARPGLTPQPDEVGSVGSTRLAPSRSLQHPMARLSHRDEAHDRVDEALGKHVVVVGVAGEDLTRRRPTGRQGGQVGKAGRLLGEGRVAGRR